MTDEGKSLQFEWDEKESAWIYRPNREFILDFGSPFDWGIDRCIPLVSKNGTRRKVLIPLSLKISSQSMSHRCNIQLSPTNKDHSKETISYLELEIEKQTLQTKSLNENLYLAGIYLAQKKYIKAYDQLAKISQSDQTNAESWQLFKQILIDTAGSFSDDSPNATAIRLHAFLTMRNLKPHANELKNSMFLDGIPNKKLENLYHNYANAEKSIYENLTLDPEQISIIQNLLNISDQDKEKQFQISSVSWSYQKKNVLFSIMGLEKKSRTTISHQKYRFVSSDIKDWINKMSDKWKNVYEQIKKLDSNSQDLMNIIYSLKYEGKSKSQIYANRELLLICAQYRSQGKSLPSIIDPDAHRWIGFLEELEGLSKTDCKKPEFLLNIHNKESERAISHATETISQLNRSELFISPLEEPQINIREVVSVTSTSPIKITVSDPTEAIEFFSKTEKRYSQAIRSHLKHYQQDQQVDMDRVKVNYALNQEVELGALDYELANAINHAHSQEEKLKESLAKLVDKQASYMLSVHHEAQKIGLAKQEIKTSQICQAAVHENWADELLKLNRNLNPQELSLLRHQAFEYMAYFTHREHCESIHTSLKAHLDNTEENSIGEFFEKLTLNRCYDINTDPFTLFFEYKSGLRLKSKQIELIREAIALIERGEYGMAFQLIMAGGKTSVVLSTYLEIFAEKGYLACVLSHHSQQASLRSNLLSFQRDRFGKDVISFGATVQELSNIDVLNELLDRIGRAKRQRCPLLMTSTFPQVLLAKFQTECLKASLTGDISKELVLLEKIIGELKANGIAFIDECDSTLSMKTEVHLPLDKEQSLPPDESDLVGSLYRFLISPELRDKVGLLTNTQDQLKENYHTEVLPLLAEKWLEDFFVEFSLVDELKPALLRLLTNQIPAEHQKLADDPKINLNSLDNVTKGNIQILRYLQIRLRNNDKVDKRQVELIGVARNFLNHILPTALSRSFNRDYGPVTGIKNQSPDQEIEGKEFDRRDVGEVVPYLGVGTPAHTKFGDPYLSLALSIQSTLPKTSHISNDEIKFLAGHLKDSIELFSVSDNLLFDDIPEAKLFKKLTTVDLRLLDDASQIAEAMKQAYEYINDSKYPERRIAFRSEVSPYHVKFFPTEVCCTPIDLIEMFSHSIAFSGTLYNHSSYHKKLGQPKLDAGTEGSILNRLENASILQVADQSLGEILKAINADEDSQRVRAIIDSGGFLKDINNEEAAKQILEKCPHINAVIYLPNGENFFKLMKRGLSTPIKLNNTSLDEIKKYVSLEELFVFYDQLRTTGTDIPLAKDSICFQTNNSKMPLRNQLQGSLRARQFFKGQKIKFLITSEGRAQLLNQGNVFKDLSMTLQKNEAIENADQTLSSYISQFANLRKKPILGKCSRAIRKNSIQTLQNSLKNATDVFSSTRKYLNYQEWLKVPQEQSTYDLLRSLAAFTPEDQELLEVAQRDQSLADTLIKSTCVSDEIYVEKQVDVQRNLVQDQQIEISLELQTQIDLELNRHVSISTFCSYQEKSWVTSDLNSELIDSNTLSVRDFFNHKFINANNQSLDCSEFISCFPENIRLTRNLQFTMKKSMPKEANPISTSPFSYFAKQTHFALFVRREDCWETVLLSKNDTVQIKKYLEDHPSDTMWLVNLNGNPTTRLLSHDLIANPDFHYGLWYANFFNGNIKYLDQHADITRKVVEQNPELITKYLLLKNGFHKTRLHQTINSKLLNANRYHLDQTQSIICSFRRKAQERAYKALRLLPQEAIQKLLPRDVKDIDPTQVPWLVTVAQIHALPRNLVKYLTDDQIQQMSAKQVSEVKNQSVISKIENQVLLQQLTRKQIKHVKPEMICCLNDEQLVHATSFQMQSLIHSDPDRVKRIVSNVNKIQEWHVPFLSDRQIQEIRTDQAHLVEKLSNDQIPKLLVKQVNEFHDGGMLSLRQQLAISDEQFIQLPDPTKEMIIRCVPNNNLNELRRWHIPYLSNSQVEQYIDETTIRYLPRSLIKYLSTEQVNEFLTKNLLSEPQLLGLVSDQVKNSIGLLSNEQIHRLGIEQFPVELPGNMMHKFSIEKLQELENAPVIQNENALRWSENAVLSRDQLRGINQNHGSLFKYISPELLSEFPIEMFNHIIQTGQINDIHLARFRFNQFPQGFSTSVIPLLNVNHLRQAKEDDWTPERLNSLTQRQIQLLTTPDYDELIKLIPSGKVIYFTQDQVKAIFHLLSLEQIRNIRPENLPRELRDYLKTEEVSKLSRVQIKAVYGAKGFFEWIGHRVYGLAVSAISISVLPVQLAWNLFELMMMTFGTPFSANVRRSWKHNLRKTIANIGKRLLPIVAIFSYPRYLEYFSRLDNYSKK